MGGSISANGCGPSSMAIVMSGYGSKQNPGNVGSGLVKKAKKINKKDPTNSTVICKYLNDQGFKTKYHSNSSSYDKTYKEMKRALSEGHQIVLYVGVGGSKSAWKNFTNSGYHFVSVLSIDTSNNKVYVGNPGKSSVGLNYQQLLRLNELLDFG